MLVEKFCNQTAADGPFKRPEAFEIHSHKVFNAPFGQLNSWVRNRTAVRLDNAMNVVTIEQDMNSVRAEGTKGKEDMLSFFDSIANELDKCFQIYYPKDSLK